jgi:hypothetical protein
MHHSFTLFREISKHIPWCLFDRLVNEHQGDKKVRRRIMRHQFMALLFGQMAGCQSLREIEAVLTSHSPRLYHSGMRTVRRSTLSDSLAKRPVEVVSGVFQHLASQLTRQASRPLQDVVLLMDATHLWGDHTLHTLYDLHSDCPLDPVLTHTKVNDITPAKQRQLAAGATYVFDLGYYNYAFWAKMDKLGCRFVSRLKINTPLSIVETLPVKPDGSVLSDRIGFLPQRMSASRSNPMADAVREITVRLDNGKVLRLVSNDLDAPAEEIARAYKSRWQIELMFKWIKQNLKVKHLLGRSDNAVRLQIMVALIAYVLIRLVRKASQTTLSLLTFARLIKAQIMHNVTPQNIAKPPDPKTKQSKTQMTFDFIKI